MKLLILAGGLGTRLWPMSRSYHPKQVQPFLNSTTLLQQTWRRLRANWRPADIYVSTTKANYHHIKTQLPELRPANLIIEPVGRNTAPAILLAAKVLVSQNNQEALATINSDHYIAQSKKYLHILSAGEQVLARHRGAIVLLGIKPSYPETGYGYIKQGKRITVEKLKAYCVEKFTEKPTLARARAYLTQGNYLWNSGLFIFYPAELLSQLDKLAPTLARPLSRLQPYQNRHQFWTVSPAAYSRLPAISFDCAVVERANNLVVLPGDFGWADVGHWRTIYDILARQPGANISRGRYLSIKSGGNLVYSLAGRLVATVGLKDTVIIDTPDSLLVCPRVHAQEVRQLVAELKKRKMEKYL